MNITVAIILVLIIINIAVSYRGFKSPAFTNAYIFRVRPVLITKDYKRLLTSGFLHINWLHVIVNMLSLYFFSGLAAVYFGWAQFLIIYFTGLAGGNLLALCIHRNHGDYSSVGASGAVCGIIFSSIAVLPGLQIGLLGLPIPAWFYGLAYVGYAIYGVRSNKTNIGHEAHLGGALIGLTVALIFHPDAFVINAPVILLIALPVILFIVLIIVRPSAVMVNNNYYNTHNNYYNIDHKYNAQKLSRQQEVDLILDKINKKGINSLSKKERQILQQHAQ